VGTTGTCHPFVFSALPPECSVYASDPLADVHNLIAQMPLYGDHRFVISISASDNSQLPHPAHERLCPRRPSCSVLQLSTKLPSQYWVSHSSCVMSKTLASIPVLTSFSGLDATDSKTATYADRCPCPESSRKRERSSGAVFIILRTDCRYGYTV
jgi:hypothetical protein